MNMPPSMREMSTMESIATVFGVGFLPGAPGTWGSLVALLPGYYLINVGTWIPLTIAIFVSLFVGIWAAGKYEQKAGGYDHSEIVVDEVCGQWIAIFPLLFIAPTDNWLADLLVAFLLFRAFDIMKPWPIRAIDRNLKGGAGVMLDDVLAGIAAAAVLYWVVPLL